MSSSCPHHRRLSRPAWWAGGSLQIPDPGYLFLHRGQSKDGLHLLCGRQASSSLQVLEKGMPTTGRCEQEAALEEEEPEILVSQRPCFCPPPAKTALARKAPAKTHTLQEPSAGSE